jgi:hypothetical protein
MILKCTNNDRVYEVSLNAVRRLASASSARAADDVYEGFASHVPPADRLGVWLAAETAADDITELDN